MDPSERSHEKQNLAGSLPHRLLRLWREQNSSDRAHSDRLSQVGHGEDRRRSYFLHGDALKGKCRVELESVCRHVVDHVREYDVLFAAQLRLLDPGGDLDCHHRRNELDGPGNNLRRAIHRFSRARRPTPMFGKNAAIVTYQHEGGDLSFLKPLHDLKELAVTGLGTTDLTPLRSLRELRGLALAGNSRLTSLAGLESLHKLRSLQISGSPLTDLSPLRGLPVLEDLQLEDAGRLNLEPLAGLPMLRQVDFQNTEVYSIEPLQRLPALEIANVPVTTPLSELRAMRAAHPKMNLTCTGRQGGSEPCPDRE